MVAQPSNIVTTTYAQAQATVQLADDFSENAAQPVTPTVAPETVLFDGMCVLCNAGVRFIIANDRGAKFRFAALDSVAGTAALAAAGRAPAGLASIVVLDADGVHERSDAALRIARGLGPPWCALALLGAVPRALRDAVYDVIARNRYRWFGTTSACLVPTAEQRARFL